MARKYRKGVKTIACNFRFQEDTLAIIHSFAHDLEQSGPTMVRIGEREILEMLTHAAKRLVDEGKVSLDDLFYFENSPTASRKN